MATSVISSPTYDPQTTAENLANAYVASTKAILDARAAKATATTSALTKLSSALTSFQSTLSGLATSSSSLTATKASFSNTAIGTATATSSAQAGSYSFFVKQMATAGQVGYKMSANLGAASGNMTIKLGSGADEKLIDVDLSKADTDGKAGLSVKELAAAINASEDNKGQLTASVMTINGETRLVLTSAATGTANEVTGIDTTGLGAPLSTDLGSANQQVMTAAKNAIVQVGGASGETIEQASNTFSIIDGVKFTVTQAQGASDAPVTLTVAADNSGTAANVQKFVDAYNTLLGVIKTLTAAGDHTLTSATGTATTSADAAFYNDAGVLNLRDRLNAMLRDATGGQSLVSYGIIGNKDGTITLDSARLNKAIAANPEGLDKLFGRAGTGVDAGVLGAMNKLTTTWTSSTGGLITQRRTQNDKLQDDIADRQVVVQNQFDNAYKRYLAQFTALQQLQSSMTSTSNMFTAMFSSSDS